MKKKDQVDDSIFPIFAYNETKTVISLDVVSGAPLTWDEYKNFLSDFLHELDVDNSNLFDDDEYLAIDN